MIDSPPRQADRLENHSHGNESEGRGGDTTALGILVVLALLMALYFVARLGGRWAENDTADMTQVIRAVVASGALIPVGAPVYPQGYGYAAVSSFLLNASGADVGALQQVIYPLVSAFLVLPTWALYREFTGGRRAATIATLLLFVQPDFLFVILRGSHERMLRCLMVICLWLLLRSFRYRDRPVTFAVHVVLFYLSAFALIATNVLFGISFFGALATALAIGWTISRLRPHAEMLPAVLASRLLSATLVASGLAFGFIFAIYPPALSSLQAVRQLGAVVAHLFLTTQVGANQYATVASGWVSLPAYFALGSGDYLLLLGSLVVWLSQGLRWLRRQEGSEGRALATRLLWLLYVAFAVQGLVAVLADRSDLLGANLELREFPSFALVAAPLVARPLSRWRLGSLGSTIGGVMFALLTALALLKATDEPVLSNKWLFYTGPELQAMAWTESHDRASSIWTGLDERLRSAYLITTGTSSRGNRWDAFSPKPETQLFVISDVTRWQSARLREPLPEVAVENRVYDDGSAQVYRSRPRTPSKR